jgi:ribosomal protein S12 methylthiotransferase
MKIGMISLGCDKNRVDSENMLYLLKSAGYELVQEEEQADVIIVNTCAFIESAKKEAIETIFEVAKLKDNNLKKLIVTGCFAQRYGKIVDFSEVDRFVDIAEEKNIVEIIENLTNEKRVNFCEFQSGRILTTPMHYAYLKIADGCNNKCAYCAIPAIRGKYYSNTIENIVNEAKNLLKEGVKEIILVAQDTTNYGIDLYKERKLVDLLRELVKLDVWKIRLLYTYPELINDELLEFIKNEDKMAKYLDIPMQHIDSMVLKKMNRKGTEESIKGLVENIRKICPQIAIRSSFIVGFPFEEEEQHKKLVEFTKYALDYAGFFIFSPEEGTIAFDYPKGVTKKVATKWQKELEKAQCEATYRNQAKYKNSIVEVIYEGIDYNSQCFYGRTEFQAPDIDTKVLFSSDFPLEIGKIYKVLINEADFNLIGKTVD